MLLQSSPERFVVRTGDLEVRFTLAHDRWRHVLAVPDRAGERILLESAEGTPDRADSSSPPFQDLRLEDLGDDVHEFQLLGQAGHAIYSAAIRCEGPAERVSFDIFGRAKRSQGAFTACSTYDLPADVEIVAAEPNRVVLRSDQFVWELSAWKSGRMEAARLVVESANTRTIAVRATTSTARNPGEPPPRGIGWQYGIRRLSGP